MIRRRLALILLAMLASLAGLAGGTATAKSHLQCPSVMLLGSRGSGDKLSKDEGIGRPESALKDALKELIPDLESWANPYDAVSVFGWNLRDLANGAGAASKLSGIGVGAYHDSVVNGRKKLAQKVRGVIRDCGDTAIVLAGYSQGAQVTADVFQRDLSGVERSKVRAIVLFGDPYFNGGDRTVARGSFSGRRDGLLGKRTAFSSNGPLVLSYCHSHDPICQGLFFRFGPTRTLDPGALTFEQHKNYTSFGEPAEAAKAIAKLLNIRTGVTEVVYRRGHAILARPLSGGPSRVLVARASASIGGSVAATASAIFWTTTDGIWRAGRDGSNPRRIVNTDVGYGPIAVETENVFWGDSSGAIWRAPLKGGSRTKLIQLPPVRGVSYTNSASDLATDGQWLYFSSTAACAIGRVGLDGRNPRPLFLRLPYQTASTPSCAANTVTVVDNQLYWALTGGGAGAIIGRSRLDGTRFQPRWLVTGDGVGPFVVRGAGDSLFWRHRGGGEPSPSFIGRIAITFGALPTIKTREWLSGGDDLSDDPTAKESSLGDFTIAPAA